MQLRVLRRIILSLASLALIFSQASASNLVVNGDFSAGNTGFTSAYTYTFNLIPESTYAIGTDPALFHDNTYSYGDHTTGTGNMMVVNPGSTANQASWQQTVSVAPNTLYNLSAWAVGWYLYEATAANLRLEINGTAVGADLLLNVPTDASWVQFGGLWDSGAATSATLRVVDLSTDLNGNDFSLDDISFSEVPEPGTVVLMLGAAALLLGRRVIRK